MSQNVYRSPPTGLADRAVHFVKLTSEFSWGPFASFCLSSARNLWRRIWSKTQLEVSLKSKYSKLISIEDNYCKRPRQIRNLDADATQDNALGNVWSEVSKQNEANARTCDVPTERAPPSSPRKTSRHTTSKHYGENYDLRYFSVKHIWGMTDRIM